MAEVADLPGRVSNFDDDNNNFGILNYNFNDDVLDEDFLLDVACTNLGYC